MTPIKEVRILLAEDEEVLRKLLCMYFEKEKYVVEQADNGVDALNLALQNDYDLIILDVLMPNMDGLTVLQELRKWKNTPVVMLSVKGGGNEQRDAIQMGATDYILKPFSPAQFIRRIKEIVETST